MISPLENSADKISLFDVVLTFSNAKLVYQFCVMSQGEANIDQDENVVRLRALMRQVAHHITDAFANSLRKQCNNTALALERHLPGSLSQVETSLNTMREFKERLIARFQGRDFISDFILSEQLTGILWQQNKEYFINAIRSLKSQRKISDEHLSKIEELLVKFQSEDDVCSLVLSDDAITPLMTEVKQTMAKITATYNFSVLNHVFAAFSEALKVSKFPAILTIDNDDIRHFGEITKDFYKGQDVEKEVGMPSHINKALLVLDKIKPVYDIQLSDFKTFLGRNSLGDLGEYIKRQFKKGAQVYQTFENVSLVSVAYVDVRDMLKSLEQQALQRKKPDLVKQIKKYTVAFEQWPQFITRLIMPLGEVVTQCNKLKEKLELVEKKKDTPASCEVDRLLDKMKTPIEILRLKILSVNALNDLSGFIKQLKSELDKPEEEPGMLSSWFAKPVNYQPLFFDLHAYFINISQSGRTEEQTNFQGILAKLKTFFEKHKVDYPALIQKGDNNTPQAQLVVSIMKRFEERAKSLQEDVSVQPEIASPDKRV